MRLQAQSMLNPIYKGEARSGEVRVANEFIRGVESKNKILKNINDQPTLIELARRGKRRWLRD